jgi:DNA-binding transcriptional LysR family regulator
MRLSVLELQILIALDEQKTLAQIGQELFLKHPSISRALHAAEQKAGVALAERAGRRLRLTSSGVELAADAREVLAQYDKLDSRLADLRTGDAGSVRIIATRTACSYILPPALEQYLRQAARASLSLEVGAPSEVWQRFVEERHDLVVAPATHQIPSNAEWLFDEHDAFYVGRTDPLVAAEPQRAVHIDTFIAPALRDPDVDQQLRRNNITFERRVDIRNLEAAKQLVESGVGAGLFGKLTTAREVADGSLVEIPWISLDVTTSWYLGQRPVRRRSVLVDRVISLLHERARGWREEGEPAGGNRTAELKTD